LEEFSQAKQEAFEVKVRNQFLEKEKTTLSSELATKDQELLLQKQENAKLKERLERLENKDYDIK
jgi:hypothetical protein